jgi:tripartite tricarboxylate transporter family receptor
VEDQGPFLLLRTSCVRAASGHATAAPPSSVMNSRRLTRGWRTVQDLVASAKAKPGSINYGSAGVGTATHIAAEKFRVAAGFEAVHVAYKGGA